MTDQEIQTVLAQGRQQIRELGEREATPERVRVTRVIADLVNTLEDRARVCRNFEESQR